MPKFQVEVCRIGYGFATIEVEADDYEQANAKALDEAGNHEFSEKSSDYVLEGEPSRESVLLGLLREIHNEIGRKVDEDAEDRPDEASRFCELDNCDIILRIRKEIMPR